jgi:hypothetical protein
MLEGAGGRVGLQKGVLLLLRKVGGQDGLQPGTEVPGCSMRREWLRLRLRLWLQQPKGGAAPCKQPQRGPTTLATHTRLQSERFCGRPSVPA